MSPARLFWVNTALGFLLLWFIGNYPALLHSWWYRDDFTYGWFFAKNSPLNGALLVYQCYVNDGRPLAFLIEWIFCLDRYPHTGINIALHWAQGIAHIALALLIALTLSRHLSRWQATLSVIPFLVWGFNGEVVLYSGTFHYIISACFSLFGLRFILTGVERTNRWTCLLGMLLTSLSFLTMQPGCTVGLLVWSILLALRLIEFGKLQKNCLWEALFLFYGNIIGGILTTWLARLNNSPRAHSSSNLIEKFNYWLELNRTFLFWPNYYPFVLKILYGILLVLGVALPAYFLLKAGRSRIFAFVLMVLLSAFILPYFANLVVAADAFSFRTFYFAPLSFTVLLGVVFGVAGNSRRIAGILAIMVAVIAVFNIGITQANARDYVHLYTKEVQVIDDMEKVAEKTHYDHVNILVAPTSANPFGLTYPWLDGHECDFKFGWSAKPFIELYSPLKVPSPLDPNAALLREKVQDLPVTPGIHFHPIPELRTTCLEIN